ncbi:MAG TPA: hypothetical protein VJ602_04620 [Paludibacter sp.]|nr:hypothetical protein [Paludibacter sp.]
MNTIEVKLFEKDTLWFEKYSPDNLDTEIDHELNEDDAPEDVALMMKVGSLFDYATLPDNQWEFYSDISVKLPHLAAVMIRSQYKLYSEDFEWDRLFVVENIKPIVSNAIMNALIEFRRICIENSVALTPEMQKKDPEIPDQMIDMVCENMVNQYFTCNKPFDIANGLAVTEVELQCPSSHSVNVTLNLTFLVMEEILFNNRGFNRRHNREVFFEIVPEMKFYSLRMKCVQIGKHAVDLTPVDVHFFLICMDCALQMILGDKADLLTPVLEERGATDEVQKVWFKSASDLLNVCRESVADSIARKEKYDWSKMIW